MNPTVLNQRYRLVELIGTGGMATVYRGEDLLLQRPIAVKFLRDPYGSDLHFRQRFLEEAQAAAKLDHANIVHIYDVGEDEAHRPYIVMELVEGRELKDIIRQSAPLPVNQALDHYPANMRGCWACTPFRNSALRSETPKYPCIGRWASQGCGFWHCSRSASG